MGRSCLSNSRSSRCAPWKGLLSTGLMQHWLGWATTTEPQPLSHKPNASQQHWLSWAIMGTTADACCSGLPTMAKCSLHPHVPTETACSLPTHADHAFRA
eukprot:scaffold124913_cov21-Tisochrysis_lutea.AAC.2